VKQLYLMSRTDFEGRMWPGQVPCHCRHLYMPCQLALAIGDRMLQHGFHVVYEGGFGSLTHHWTEQNAVRQPVTEAALSQTKTLNGEGSTAR